MPAPKEVVELVRRFKENLESYMSTSYNETQLRREFVDPFFKALGWDIDNSQGHAEAYKDVIHEDAIKIGSTIKAPDYCFRIGGTRKFFLETKKPSINIKDDVHSAFQLRRYGWSAKLPVSILTDFEEFSVYDCRIKPSDKDKASSARITYYSYKDYIEKWDQISEIFSKESILKGSFDKYAEQGKGKHGTQTVDDAFLEQIDEWRKDLAQNIAIRNPKITQPSLNYAVQVTLDRLIFLRICEDRGIETYGKLLSNLNGKNIYDHLCESFREADERYNSGLFHFNTEKDRLTSPDLITLALKIDDDILQNVIKKFYYPESPYEFSVLPADILGSVYERFLGKIIRLTDGHRAKIDEKPEVKKAGGVFYTPSYIVNYIVENTVGRKLVDKKPEQVSSYRLVDPACGSGSFLIGAYQKLLDWHLEWYANNSPKKWLSGKSPAICQSKNGLRLTTSERKRILINNIFGVDIDAQAVEVTKLSLLLKVLEGETGETLANQLRLLHERALPDLESNIKCGNSVIEPDYSQMQGELFIDETLDVNPFNWNSEFKDIFKSGGFDTVIGNPPYVFGRDWKALNIPEAVKVYLGKKYKTVPYQLDMFSIFIERANWLAKAEGMVGQIVPNVWLSNTYSSLTRNFLIENSEELKIVSPPKGVFKGLTVDTIVYVLKKNKNKDCSGKMESISVTKLEEDHETPISTLKASEYISGERPISVSVNTNSRNLALKLLSNNKRFDDFVEVTRGVHPYRTGGFGKSAFSKGSQTLRDVEERPYNSNKGGNEYRPFVYGRDLRFFAQTKASDFIKYGPWLAEPREPKFFKGVRIYSRKILAERLVVTVEDSNSIADQQVYISLPKFEGISAHLLSGILGSKAIAFFIRAYFDEKTDAFPQIKVSQLRQLPMPNFHQILKSNNADLDVIEASVKKILLINDSASENTPQLNDKKNSNIKSILANLDKAVYNVFDLGLEDIKLIESELAQEN